MEINSEIQLRALFIESCAEICWESEIFKPEDKENRSTLCAAINSRPIREFLLSHQSQAETRMFRIRKKFSDTALIPGITAVEVSQSDVCNFMMQMRPFEKLEDPEMNLLCLIKSEIVDIFDHPSDYMEMMEKYPERS